jgi:hypothetical protein
LIKGKNNCTRRVATIRVVSRAVER